MSRRKRRSGRSYEAIPPIGERVASIEAVLDHLATKADLSKEMTKQTRWTALAVFGAAGLVIAAVKLWV